MSKYKVYFILICVWVGLSGKVHAQEPYFPVGVRTSVLGIAFGSLGVGADYGFKEQYMVSVDGSLGCWKTSGDWRGLRFSGIGVEARRYFRKGATSVTQIRKGAYVGLDVRFHHFNVKTSAIGREGEIISTGILGGYSLPLDKKGHWGLDGSIGVGYLHKDYVRYEWYESVNMNRRLSNEKRNMFGLTHLNIMLTYRFGHKKSR